MANKVMDKQDNIYLTETDYDTLVQNGSITKGGETVNYDAGNLHLVPFEDTPIATTSLAGKVKPDGITITITQDGTISSFGGVTDTRVNNVSIVTNHIANITKDATPTFGSNNFVSSGGVYDILPTVEDIPD